MGRGFASFLLVSGLSGIYACTIKPQLLPSTYEAFFHAPLNMHRRRKSGRDIWSFRTACVRVLSTYQNVRGRREGDGASKDQEGRGFVQTYMKFFA